VYVDVVSGCCQRVVELFDVVSVLQRLQVACKSPHSTRCALIENTESTRRLCTPPWYATIPDLLCLRAVHVSLKT